MGCFALSVLQEELSLLHNWHKFKQCIRLNLEFLVDIIAEQAKIKNSSLHGFPQCFRLTGF